MPTGNLKIHVFKGYSFIPLENAKVTVIQNKETSNRQINANLLTDSSGVTNEIELEAPLLEYSMKPSDKSPYSLCNIIVEVPGYKKLIIDGSQIYPGVTSVQHCYLKPIGTRQTGEDIIKISANTLFGNYPIKEPESQTPPRPPIPGHPHYHYHITIKDQIIPNSIIVHDGYFEDTSATDFDVYYKEYIKNVASSEIYPTWPTEAIKANVYAIISFTLNRVFTEWYLGKGKKFQITSSTATDHKYTNGISFSANVEKIVNEIFSTYIKRPRYEFPMLSQYTDGVRVPHREGWMTQWGSKDLADQGKTALEILDFYYGSEITLFKVEKMGYLHPSFPGYALQIGAKGQPVKIIQKNLNTTAKSYPLIPKVSEDGIFGEATKKAVETFQGVFSLDVTGIVDYATWYKLSDLYVGLTSGDRRSNRVIEREFLPPISARDISNIPRVTYFDNEE